MPNPQLWQAVRSGSEIDVPEVIDQEALAQEQKVKQMQKKLKKMYR